MGLVDIPPPAEYHLAIIGAGPAGLSAAARAAGIDARAGRSTPSYIVLEGSPRLAKTIHRLNDPNLWFIGTNDQPGDYQSLTFASIRLSLTKVPLVEPRSCTQAESAAMLSSACRRDGLPSTSQRHQSTASRSES